MNTTIEEATRSLTITGMDRPKDPVITAFDASDLTTAGPLASIVLTFTNRCNLRYVYCTVGTHVKEYYADASPQHLERMLETIARTRVRNVYLGFYGETTVFDGWSHYAQRIADLGCSLSGVFNFSRILTDEEVSVLSRFASVTVSIDTFDRDTLRELRRSVDVGTIVYNIQLLRSHCVANGLRIPDMQWSAVLSDRIVPHLKRFIAFAAVNGVRHVEFQHLIKNTNSKLENLRNVCELRGQELITAFQAIADALNLAAQYKLGCTIHGLDQLNRLSELLSHGGTPSTAKKTVLGISDSYEIRELDSDPIPPGCTRDCVAPWTEAWIDQSGYVYPCCHLGQVMDQVTAETDLEHISNQEPLRVFRRALLTGEGLGVGCQYCATKPIVHSSVLRQRVAAHCAESARIAP